MGLNTYKVINGSGQRQDNEKHLILIKDNEAGRYLITAHFSCTSCHTELGKNGFDQ